MGRYSPDYRPPIWGQYGQELVEHRAPDYALAYLRRLAGEAVTLPKPGHWETNPEDAAAIRARVDDLLGRAARR